MTLALIYETIRSCASAGLIAIGPPLQPQESLNSIQWIQLVSWKSASPLLDSGFNVPTTQSNCWLEREREREIGTVNSSTWYQTYLLPKKLNHNIIRIVQNKTRKKRNNRGHKYTNATHNKQFHSNKFFFFPVFSLWSNSHRSQARWAAFPFYLLWGRVMLSQQNKLSFTTSFLLIVSPFCSCF